MKRLSENKKHLAAVYAAGAALLIAAALLGLLLGAADLSLRQLLQAIACKDMQSPEARIFWYVRLPRVAACVLCGAALAVSGAVIQAVLANRLASPGIIGVNSGAGLAVTLCAAMGTAGGWQFSVFAFAGAFAAVMAVSLGARHWGASRGTVILMGVAVNSLLGAVSDTVAVFLPHVSIMRSDFKVGDFSAVTYSKLLPAAVMILASLAALQTLCNELDVLALGDESAKGLGMNTAAARTLFLMLAAALAGAAVSIAGLLSFVGLVVPHAVRRLSCSESAHLLPLCALYGGGFVALCDTAARTLFAPYELPAGIIMAFLGAPFFLFILFKGKGGHGNA